MSSSRSKARTDSSAVMREVLTGAPSWVGKEGNNDEGEGGMGGHGCMCVDATSV